jgi:hypothetical protein
VDTLGIQNMVESQKNNLLLMRDKLKDKKREIVSPLEVLHLVNCKMIDKLGFMILFGLKNNNNSFSNSEADSDS